MILYGALTITLGIAALLAPFLATIAASVSFGALLLGSGVLGLAMLALDWRVDGFVWRLLWSLVAIISGLCIIIHPLPGALGLTLVLGVSLIIQGALSVGHAVVHRNHKGCPWGQMAFSGVVSALLGSLLIWALPNANLVVPGVFLAVHLVSFGFSLTAVALNNGKAAS